MVASWKEKKQRLIALIKNISDQNGGDDPIWLKSYTEQVLKDWASKLDEALICFEDIWKQGMTHEQKLELQTSKAESPTS